MNNFIEVTTNKGKAKLYKGFPKENIPKTYIKIDTLHHNIGNDYNPSYLSIFRVKTGLRYEIYRDGCFFPYYGKFEYIK